MTEDGGKVTGIRHIVRLREILQKWQSITLSTRATAAAARLPSGIPPAVTQRLKSLSYISDSDEESGHSPDHLPDIPKGYLAVYVGPELRRFIIPTSYLSLPVFKALLEKAEEEFGFDHPNGALTLPCEIETFKYILSSMGNDKKSLEEVNEGNSSSLEEE